MSMYTSAPAGLTWRISSKCESGACLMVARQGELILIGNTKHPEGPVSVFTRDEWRNFITGIKLGAFDGIA